MTMTLRLSTCAGGLLAVWSAAAQPVPLHSQAGQDELWNDRGKVSEVDSKAEWNSPIIKKYTGIELGYAGSGVGDVDGDTLDDFAATYYWHDYPFSPTDQMYLNDPSTTYTLQWPFQVGDGEVVFPAGDVRVFGFDGAGIAQIGGNLRHRDPIYAGRFAHNIRGRADVDGDGRDDIIAGSGVGGGVSVWAFTDRYTGTEEWVQILRIREPQTAHDKPTYNGQGGGIQQFGWAVAECTDMNGDNVPDVIIGTRGYDDLNPFLRGLGIGGETPSDNEPKSEGAVLVYNMPPQSWWHNFRAPVALEPGKLGLVSAGEYWETYVSDRLIDAEGHYTGEPIVNINGKDADIYYSIRITDPSLSHAILDPESHGEHLVYLDSSVRQWEFGSAVRTARDLDGDTAPDILALAGAHLHDHDNNPATADVRTGKAYVYFSSSGVRDGVSDPVNSFAGLDPVLHAAWEYDQGLRSTAPDPETEHLNILVGDADLIIVGPPPVGSGILSGMATLTEDITEVMPYNDDGYADVFISCNSKLNGNTNNGFAAFFEIEKRVKEEITAGGTAYPTAPQFWTIPLDRWLADTGPVYPDRYLSVTTGRFNGISMAGDVDNMGKCEVRMSVHGGQSEELICSYNPYRVVGTLVGNFETIWRIDREPSSADPLVCGSIPGHEGHAMHGGEDYLMLEPFEYALPNDDPGSDQVATGGTSKDISRWWWAGDVNGDNLDDMLGAAWSYPSMFEDASGIVCDPVAGGTTIDLFRGGKIYLFPSPFNAPGNGQDADTDGVNDAVDGCVSVAELSNDNVVNVTDEIMAMFWIEYRNGTPVGTEYPENSQYRVYDIDRNGVIEFPTDFNAFLVAYPLGCQ